MIRDTDVIRAATLVEPQVWRQVANKMDQSISFYFHAVDPLLAARIRIGTAWAPLRAVMDVARSAVMMHSRNGPPK